MELISYRQMYQDAGLNSDTACNISRAYVHIFMNIEINSPYLNPTENLREIVKDRVESLMHLEAGQGHSQETLRKNYNRLSTSDKIPNIILKECQLNL
uniref:Uncharacterized protein n=1 Tax=Romanomermis culicivorax TaxID=13658 RepID=A0A915HHB4_ROMCU